jgi:hypothetical protein
MLFYLLESTITCFTSFYVVLVGFCFFQRIFVRLLILFLFYLDFSLFLFPNSSYRVIDLYVWTLLIYILYSDCGDMTTCTFIIVRIMFLYVRILLPYYHCKNLWYHRLTHLVFTAIYSLGSSYGAIFRASYHCKNNSADILAFLRLHSTQASTVLQVLFSMYESDPSCDLGTMWSTDALRRALTLFLFVSKGCKQ